MSETYDYKPAPHWQGHDFDAARTAYQKQVASSYQDPARQKLSTDDLIEPFISSEARRPLVILVDETGSMDEWPATMFSKLPYLEHETKNYLGDDVEISFGAIGDAAKREKHALQIRPFTMGADLAKYLQELEIEGGGGGNGGETYELGALYLARNMQVDPLAEPIVIFIGDEPYFDTIDVDDAKKYSKVTLAKAMRSSEAFGELCRKAAVYFIQKPYNASSSGNHLDPITQETHSKWTRLLGEEHVAMLPDPTRVVDVIFGILAAEVDRVDDFRAEIESRQTQAQVKTVYKSLATIHAVGTTNRRALRSGNSVMFDSSSGKASKPLLGS